MICFQFKRSQIYFKLKYSCCRDQTERSTESLCSLLFRNNLRWSLKSDSVHSVTSKQTEVLAGSENRHSSCRSPVVVYRAIFCWGLGMAASLWLYFSSQGNCFLGISQRHWIPCNWSCVKATWFGCWAGSSHPLSCPPTYFSVFIYFPLFSVIRVDL